MSCSRRHHTCASTAGEADRRSGSSAVLPPIRRSGSAAVLPPIAEERLLDNSDDAIKDGDDDDEDSDAGDCCRCCCQRRDLEAPPIWRDLDIHGVRCMLPLRRRRQRGCLRVAVRRYVSVLHCSVFSALTL